MLLRGLLLINVVRAYQSLTDIVATVPRFFFDNIK